MLSEEMKEKNLQLLEEGMSKNYISNTLIVPRTTIYSFIKRYTKNKSIKNSYNKCGRKRKLNDTEISFIKKTIDKKCETTLNNISEGIKKKLKKTVCVQTVNNYISDFNYTLKAVKKEIPRLNDKKSILARCQYSSVFTNIVLNRGEEKVFFIDESGFSVSMRCKRGRSLRGKPAVLTCPTMKSKNISVCAAFNRKGLMMLDIVISSFNSIKFGIFLQKLIKMIEKKKLNECVFIMDNASIHKTKEIKAMVEKTSHELLYLPPYSPFLNPIENCFSKWKNYVKRSRVKSEKMLYKKIKEGFNSINPADCDGYWKNMLVYLEKCKKKEKIV